MRESHYCYRALGIPAFRKYKVKPEVLITILEEMFSIFFKVGFQNPRFERTYLWHYTMWENYFFRGGGSEE